MSEENKTQNSLETIPESKMDAREFSEYLLRQLMEVYHQLLSFGEALEPLDYDLFELLAAGTTF